MSANQSTRNPESDKGQDDAEYRKDGFFHGIKATHVAELILAVVLVIVSIWQGWLIAGANELASDTAKRQLRAYVSPTKAEVLDLTDTGPLRVRITMCNCGQTPAYATTIEVDSWWEDANPPLPPMTGAMPTTPRSQTTLAAGEEIYIDQTVKPRRQELRNGRAILHAAGVIRYTDIYGATHQSSFHFVQGGDYDPMSSTMGLGRNGNTSD